MVRERSLDTVLALGAFTIVVAPRHVAAIHRRAEGAEIDQEESTGLRVPANAGVLARYIHRRDDADVDGIRDPPAADRDGVLGNIVRVLSGVVFVGQPCEYSLRGEVAGGARRVRSREVVFGPEWTVVIFRVRAPAPSSGLSGRSSSESTRMSPSARSPSGSGTNSMSHSRPAFCTSGPAIAEHARGIPVDDRSPVQRPERLIEGADRFRSEDRNNSFQPRVFAGMEVDNVTAWREHRVLERLDVLAHVDQDGLDQVACRSSARFRATRPRRCIHQCHTMAKYEPQS